MPRRVNSWDAAAGSARIRAPKRSATPAWSVGHFSASFKTGSPKWDIKAGDFATVYCKLPTGDVVAATGII